MCSAVAVGAVSFAVGALAAGGGQGNMHPTSPGPTPGELTPDSAIYHNVRVTISDAAGGPVDDASVAVQVRDESFKTAEMLGDSVYSIECADCAGRKVNVTVDHPTLRQAQTFELKLATGDASNVMVTFKEHKASAFVDIPEIRHLEGFLAGVGDCCTDNGTPGCDDDDCEALVCAADSFCCTSTWDGLCVIQAEMLCGDLCGGGVGPSCDTGVGCQNPDQGGHGAQGIVGATSDLNPGAGFAVSDNFTAVADGNITSVCWWGIYVDFGGPSQCGPGTGDNFTINYYADNVIGPGALLASFAAGDGNGGLSGNVIPTGIGDIDEYAYTASHDPFPVTAGECYWIEIVNNTTGTCFWLWTTAPPGDNKGSQSGAPTDYDMAFCVDVDIEPDGCTGGGGGECNPGDDVITVNILLDDFPEETSWTVALEDGTIVGAGGPYAGQPGALISEEVCVAPGACWTFTIFDAFGDGICCGFGIGNYEILLNGASVCSGGEFGSSESCDAPSCDGGGGGGCGDCEEPDPAGAPGCSDPTCEAIVCAADSFCCAVAWDSICAGQATDLCDCEGGGGGGCGDCEEPDPAGAPGCSDPTCEAIVCAADSFCCAVAWDSICAGQATDLCDCEGGGGGDCTVTVSITLDDFPEETTWTLSDANGTVATGGPYATPGATVGGDFDVTGAWTWTIFDAFGDGICCGFGLGSYEISQDGEVVCSGGEFGASESCSGDCGGGGPGGCGDCEEPDPAGAPGCSDPTCEAIVCAADSFCCAVAWDSICAGQATDLCDCDGGGPGDCDAGQDTVTVSITFDDFPEETSWNITDQEGNLIDQDGPFPGATGTYTQDVCVEAGSCWIFTIFDAFGDGICCGFGLGSYEILLNGEVVCSGGEFGAEESCEAPTCEPLEPPANDDCNDAEAVAIGSSTAGTTIGASDDNAPTCGTSVTAPGVWYTVVGDGTTLTASLCNEGTAGPIYDPKLNVYCGSCPEGDASDCCEANGSPGCDDPTCEATVCGADSFCCAVEWDGICAAAAADLCPDLCGAGAGGLVCIGGNDDGPGCPLTGGGFALSEFSWCSQNGATYYILVQGFGGSQGPFVLDVDSDGAGCSADVLCLAQGACCIGADCVITTEGDCADQGGEYQGDGTACFQPDGDPAILSSEPNLPISVTLPPAVDTIVMGMDYPLADVNVNLNLTHTWVGDLTITLTHAGTTVTLMNGACGSANDVMATADDEGPDVNCGPTTGSFNPDSAGGGSLSDFDGLSSAGEWTLTVTDNAGGDDGTLISWGLELDGGSSVCGPVCEEGIDVCADGKPQYINLIYTAGDCIDTTNYQEGKFECTQYAALPDCVYIVATKKKCASYKSKDIYFEGEVCAGDEFSVDAANLEKPKTKLKSKTYICIFSANPDSDGDGHGDDGGGVLLAELNIHTSCSKDLFTGDVFGPVLLCSGAVADDGHGDDMGDGHGTGDGTGGGLEDSDDARWNRDDSARSGGSGYINP